MAWTLLFPSIKILPSSSIMADYNSIKSTRRRVSVMASSDNKTTNGKGREDEKPAFSPFGFVTDNPSSRGAIQLPESPAEDGNVGQMLYRIEDKGKDYGSYIKSGKHRWFVRETGSIGSRRGTIVFLHGAPTQSYSYRVVMAEVLLLVPDFIR